MGKRLLAVIIFLLIVTPCLATAAPSQVRVSVFNFGTVNIDASGLGASVTNMLLGLLGEDQSLSMLDRKELESFLGMNDLQQNDQIDNVVNIGNRLGLNVIVVGSVEKKGSVIVVQCKTIHIEKKKVIFTARVGAVGDAGLNNEVRKLSQQIRTAIGEQVAGDKNTSTAVFGGPVGLMKKAGNRSVQLFWEAPPGATVEGYEIFRAAAENGPFSRIAQVAKTEYLDEEIDKDTTYYYKIRAYNDRGLQSEFSQTVDARAAITPNPPVIIKAEGRVKGIYLTWSPGPSGADPLRLKGYRLYRAKAEQGPYREIVNLQTTDLGEVTATLDRLLKVNYLDKGLADGEDYYYRVTSFNEKELESGFSKSIKGTVIPTIREVSVEGGLIREIRLSWKPIDSPVVRAYNIYRSKSENEGYVPIKKIEAPSSNDRKITYADRDNLLDLTRYYYKIVGVEESTETAFSPAVSAETRGKPPKLLALKAADGLVKKVELTWQASTAEEVEGYKIYGAKEKESEFSLFKTISGRQTDRYTDEGRGFDKLLDGTIYRYRMTTYNRVDVESEPTETVSARTKPRPQKPVGLQGESAKVKSVPLQWSPNPEKDIVQYHLYRSTETGDFERIARVRETRYLDQGLKDNTMYRYRLQAEDKDELIGDFSDTISVRTKPKPAVLGGVSTQIESGKVVLSWKESPEADIDHYTVYEKKLFGMDKIGEIRQARFSEPAPLRGKIKRYLITATDRDGLESETGPEIEITGP